MMIHQPFLMSVVSSLILGYKNNSFESSEKIDQKFNERIINEMSSMIDKGVSSFPVIINIIGPIIKYSDYYYTGTQTILGVLRALEEDDRVSGVLFNIDSGGGMGDRELAEFIFNMETPTIGFSNGLVCSAAQWIFSACKYKIMSPHASWAGSIGTYFPFSNMEGILEKLGAQFKDIYAPESTLKNLYYREMVENNNPALFEEMAKSFNDEFVADIKMFYGDKLTDDGKVFKGHIYRPTEALYIGLVDELCSLNEALEKF